MSEIATFFRHRDDQGETFHLDASGRQPPYQISAYWRTKMPFKMDEVPDQWKTAQQRVEQAASGRGGGIVVAVSGEGPKRFLKITMVDAKNPPEQFALISPGAVAALESLPRETSIAAVSHVIVPVNADAEKKLVLFVQQLPWFSKDLEMLVLNAIRRPSLDTRLNRVEKQLFGRSEGQSDNVAKIDIQKLLSYALAVLIVAL